jgi:hypothetical protein
MKLSPRFASTSLWRRKFSENVFAVGQGYGRAVSHLWPIGCWRLTVFNQIAAFSRAV